jgi:hypothetical protein
MPFAAFCETLRCSRVAPVSIAMALVMLFSVNASAADLHWDGSGGSWSDFGSWSASHRATTPEPGARGSSNGIDLDVIGVITATGNITDIDLIAPTFCL